MDENLEPIPELKALQENLPPAWEASGRRITTEREYNLSIKGLWPYFTPDFTAGFPNVNTIVNNKIATPLIQGKVTVANAVDSVKAEIQAIIDEFK